MKKIIHITDTHCKKGEIQHRFQVLIQQIINTFTQSQEYIIVLTGDIVDEANDINYNLAHTQLNQLTEAGFQLLCCPGNRDYGTPSMGNKKFINVFEDTFLNENSDSFPIKNVFNSDNKTFVLIGLESMGRELIWTKSTSVDGEIGKQQLHRLEFLLGQPDILNSDFLAIYLHHSPFSTDNLYQLKDKALLKKILVNSQKLVDVLLFGHKHDGVCWHGHWGIPMIFGGGSSTLIDNSVCVARVIDPEKSISANSLASDDFIKKYVASLKENSLI